MAGYSKAFTAIPMNELDAARAAAKAQMAEIYKATGVRMRMRTFYLGSRRKRSDMHVRKALASGAKLAFYKRVTGVSGFVYYSLVGYYLA